MKNKLVLTVTLALITLVVNAQNNQPKQSLSIGDLAPKLEVHKWIKGTPVKGFEKGKVYVVECWATWCAPCIMAMPHLSDLARKYQDKATIIGVSVWERNSKPVPDEAAIKSFVDKKGKDMDYIVAMDDPAQNKFADAWLSAAGLKGIPATFVIDRNGKIAWIGHPMDVDSILKQVIEKPETVDIAKVKEQYNKEQVLQAKRQAAQSILGYGMSKNHGLAFQQAQKQIKEDPSFEVENFWIIIRAYLNINGKMALSYVDGKQKDAKFLKALNEGKGMTSEEVLNTFAQLVGQQPGLDIGMYYEAIERINKIAQRKTDDVFLLSTLAQTYTNINEPAKAILAQEKAIEVFKREIKPNSENDFQEKALESMIAKLEEYKKLKERKEMFSK